MKVHRQCPVVLLVKVGGRQGKAVRSEEGTVMKSGERREVEHGRTALEILVLGEILMLRGYFRAEF
jgi:hypothetical protein